MFSKRLPIIGMKIYYEKVYISMQMKRVKNRGLSDEVKAAIYEYIKSMDIQKSNKLPREEVMAELLGVSRITVRSALNELATEGIIFRRQGKGTFVNPEAVQMKVTLNSLELFMDMIKNSGYSPSVKVLKVETINASEAIADKLKIKTGDELISIEKLFYADDNPAVYCINYIAKGLINQSISNQEYEIPIFELIKTRTGKTITWDKVEIYSVTNEGNENLTKYFNCDGKVKPLLLCEGVNYDDANEPIVYAYEYFDTDYVRFNLIRQKHVNDE